MRKVITAAIATAALAWTAPVFAAHGVTLTGGATLEADHVKLVSNTGDAIAANDFSGIDFTPPGGLTFAGITELRTQFNVTDDDCGGGAPRFQIEVDMGGGVKKNVHVYLGPTPNFTGCTPNTWLSSGNLAGTSELRVDTSQVGGQFYDNWAGAVAKVGTKTVTDVDIVVDAGWFFASDQEQTVLIRNVGINGHEWFVPGAPSPGRPDNPANLCKAQRALIGEQAFAELWGTNANDRNAFGKCVSAMAKAQNVQATQAAIMKTSRECKAKGLRGMFLGACISRNDGVAATKADPPNRGKKKGRR